MRLHENNVRVQVHMVLYITWSSSMVGLNFIYEFHPDCRPFDEVERRAHMKMRAWGKAVQHSLYKKQKLSFPGGVYVSCFHTLLAQVRNRGYERKRPLDVSIHIYNNNRFRVPEQSKLSPDLVYSNNNNNSEKSLPNHFSGTNSITTWSYCHRIFLCYAS